MNSLWSINISGYGGIRTERAKRKSWNKTETGRRTVRIVVATVYFRVGANKPYFFYFFLSVLPDKRNQSKTIMRAEIGQDARVVFYYFFYIFYSRTISAWFPLLRVVRRVPLRRCSGKIEAIGFFYFIFLNRPITRLKLYGNEKKNNIKNVIILFWDLKRIELSSGLIVFTMMFSQFSIGNTIASIVTSALLPIANFVFIRCVTILK